MKRYTAVKNLIGFFSESDIVVFSGKELCREAYQHDRPGYFYIEDCPGMAVSFGLGVALGTDKRVYVFTGEGDLLRNVSVIGQMAVSKCTNIFLIVLNNGVYQSAGNFPNIFSGFTSKKGMVHGFGCLVFDFTTSLKTRNNKNIRSFIDRVRGPEVIFIDVDVGVKRGLSDVGIGAVKQRDRFSEFVRDRDIETAEVQVPSLSITSQDSVLGVLDLSKGGID